MLSRLLALILCSLCFSTGSASSQSIDMPPTAMDAVELLSGRYKYVGNPDKDHAVIDKSIEAAISSLGWLGRKIARSRLANHKELPSRIEISRAGDNVAVKMGKFSAVAPSDGSERELIGPNGRDSKLHYQLEPETIVQFFVFEHAQRKSTYSFNDEGQLIMTVYMTSEKLVSPIEYALAYEAE